MGARNRALFLFEEGGKIMIAAKECCIRGEILLDGAYSTGRGIASSYLLRFSPLEGDYNLYETGRAIWLINKKFENSKLEYSRKELHHRLCASSVSYTNLKLPTIILL